MPVPGPQALSGASERARRYRQARNAQKGSQPVPEKDLQQAIVDAAVGAGWLVYHPFDSRRSEEGFPDLVLIHPERGLIKAVECKSATGETTAAQDRWLLGFAKAGVPAFVVRPAGLDRMLEELGIRVA